MPIRLKRGVGRRIPEMTENPEFSSAVRMAAEETRRDLEQVAEHIPGSKHDTLSFVSRGTQNVIQIANSLSFIPTAVSVCRQTGPGSVWSSGKLADEEFIYVETDAVAGVRFTLRFWS